MKKQRLMFVCLGLGVLLISACATRDVHKQTAGVLGYKTGEIEIKYQDSDPDSLYYTVKTPSGEYACQRASKMMQMMQVPGVVIPPQCRKK